MNVQIIDNNGKPEWAVLPYNDYLRLKENSEMLQDIHDYDRAKEELRRTGEERIPSELVFALIEGANPLRTWREYRHLSQNDLAQKAGISVPYLSQLESDKRKGSLQILEKLAGILNLTVDDLLRA